VGPKDQFVRFWWQSQLDLAVEATKAELQNVWAEPYYISAKAEKYSSQVTRANKFCISNFSIVPNFH